MAKQAISRRTLMKGAVALVGGALPGLVPAARAQTQSQAQAQAGALRA